MIAKSEVRRWLSTLPQDDAVYIDEGGLALRSTLEPEAYLEIGGAPDAADEGDAARPRCPVRL